MYYAVNNSRCVHAGAVCRRARVNNATPVRFDPSRMRKCKFCCEDVTECYCCLEEYAHSITAKCGSHSMCNDCVERNIEVLRENSEWNCKVTCPCGSEFDHKLFNKRSKEMIDKYKLDKATRTDSHRRFHYDVIVENILTLKCPKCDKAFVDFDGCLALQCNCGTYFCGKCMEEFDSNRDAHNHVLVCHGNYYMSKNEWERHIATFKVCRIFRYILRTVEETKSVLYGYSLWYMILPHCVTFNKWFVYISYIMSSFMLICYPRTSLIAMYTTPLILMRIHGMLEKHSKKNRQIVLYATRIAGHLQYALQNMWGIRPRAGDE